MSYARYSTLGNVGNVGNIGNSSNSGGNQNNHSHSPSPFSPQANSLPGQVNTDSSPHLLKSAEEKSSYIKNYRLLVVYIYGDWCGPCKRVAPIYSELASQYSSPGKVALVKEDVDDEISNINGVPTFQIYYNGMLKEEITGADIPRVQGEIEKLSATL